MLQEVARLGSRKVQGPSKLEAGDDEKSISRVRSEIMNAVRRIFRIPRRRLHQSSRANDASLTPQGDVALIKEYLDGHGPMYVA